VILRAATLAGGEQMESEGLLTIQPNRGAIVTTLTPEHALELFEVPAVLMGEDTEDQLFLILRGMRRATATSVDAFTEQHNAFHEAIRAGSGAPRLSAENKRLAR
jgi:DNA-binding GntR family transcriptional regulator